MKTYLVTGAAGFIGANYIKYILAKHEDIKVVILDALTYAGNLGTIAKDVDNERCFFIKGNICDRELADRLFSEYKFDYIVNFAAESHVDNSIKGPRAFINTNLVGTFNLLEAARTHWFDAPFSPKPGCEARRFHHISTDEVYGTLGAEGFFKETTPYAPNSPYSASKAGSDFLVRAYHHTFGMNVTTSNCSNNYGPKQHSEKLIPTIIRNCLNLSPIPIYGNGQNIRDWLYVTDHAKAIDLIFHHGKSGETYNVGGHNEKQNIEIVKIICKELGKPESLITHVGDRKGHDMRYAIDPTKIHNELGWLPETKFEDGIKKTIQWYINNREWWETIISGEYQHYYAKMYGNR